MSKKTLIKFLTLVFFVAASIGSSGIDTETVTATGTGATENEALYDALNMAVIKAGGINIQSRTDVINLFGGSQTGFVPVMGSSSFLIEGELTRQTVERSFKGYIKTFEVVSTQQRAGSETVASYFEVTVEAQVYKYSHPLPDTTDRRARLVISNFKQAAGTLSLAERLSAAATDGFTSTNKFNVLDRDYLADFATERNILLSDDAAMADKARLALVSGADFMLSGTIRQFSLENVLRRQQSTNRKLGLYQAKVEVEYRLIIPSTLQTRLSDTIEFSMSPEQVNALWEKTTPADLELDTAAVQKAVAEMLAEKIVDAVTDKAYPILVAHIEDDVVYLNEGGKRISEGDILEVFNKSQEIEDPQTGLSLGGAEQKIAAVRVEISAEKMSFAKVISGDINKIETGAICRKAAFTPPVVAKEGSTVPTLQGRQQEAFSQFTPAKIAVLPFRTAGTRCTYLGEVAASRDIAEKLDQYLTTALSKTGKFELLDRDYQIEYDREIQLILDNSPIEDILPNLEKVSGADYLLVGRLAQFDVARNTNFVQAASLTTRRYTAQVRLEYRIIELATRKIAYSDTKDIVLNDEQLKAMLPQLASSEDRELGETQIKYTLLSMAASDITGELIDAIFPILVVAVDGNTIAINAGGDILTEGQQVLIFKQGRQIIDPYTAAKVGRFDTKAATAVVTKVLPAISYAVITNGEVEEGYVCRPVKKIRQDQSDLKKSNMRRTPSGGVYLPMDE